MNELHVKKGDTVLVISGGNYTKGKRGRVLSVNPDKQMVLVEGLNFAQHHVKPKNEMETGRIEQREAAIRACKLMRICPHCDKPTRPKHGFVNDGDNKPRKIRICKKCNETI